MASGAETAGPPSGVGDYNAALEAGPNAEGPGHPGAASAARPVQASHVAQEDSWHTERRGGSRAGAAATAASAAERLNNHWFAHCNADVIKSSLIASLSSGLFGYDIGVTSGALLFVTQAFSLNHVQQEVFVGMLNLVSLVGALLAGRVADVTGRRPALQVSALLFFSGSLCEALSVSYPALLAGRVISGAGIGFGMALAPLYIAEIAPEANRGGLVSFGELLLNMGLLLGFTASFLLGWLAPAWLSWRLMLAGGALLALLFGVGIGGIPESPRWLILHRRMEQGALVLHRICNSAAEARQRFSEIAEAADLRGQHFTAAYQRYPTAAYQQFTAEAAVPTAIEMADLQKQAVPGAELDGELAATGTAAPPTQGGYEPSASLGSAGGAGGPHNVWRELLWPSPAVARMLLVLLGVNFFRQATGVDAMVYYSPEIFRRAGIQTTQALLGATLAVGFVKVFFVFVAVLLIDRHGRRPLLLTSAAGMMFACLAQALGFLLLQLGNPGGAPPALGLPAVLAVLANCTFVAFFSIGLGPINWLLAAEIFPLRLRAQAMGLGTAVNRAAAGVVAMTFLSLEDALGPSGPFFVFSAMGLLALVFFFFRAPETKDKTLEQVVRMFERSDYARHPERSDLAPLGSLDGNSDPKAGAAVA